MKSRIVTMANSLDVWLVLAAALGAWLRFSRLGDFDNQYYTATVASMLKSPSNFLFASFDPGGVVTVDKPPVSFWMQAIPVSLFGPSRWAVSLPQAIAGALAIVLLYLAVRPAFGRVAAAASALVLAVMPASAVIDSRNEPDSLLSFTLLLAALSIVRAAQTGAWRWLMVFAVVMGVAFNIKMLVAFVPLPAFLLYYALASRQPLRRAAIRTASAILVLLLLSFSWAAAVALTPAEHRPYVGSTRDNSIWTLVFYYNGLDRFTSFIGPRPGQPGAPPPPGAQPGIAPSQQPLATPGYSQPPLPGQPQPPPPSLDAAGTGLLGLFTQRLAMQTGCLLPLALLMLMVALAPHLTEKVFRRPRTLPGFLRESPMAAQTVLWIGWFATAVMVFGLADSTTTHPYYLVGLAVPLAAVTGAGFAVLWRTFRDDKAMGWLLPGALVGSVLYQIVAAHRVATEWATTVALVIMPLAVLGMTIAIRRRVTASPLASAFVVVGALAVLAIPLAFAINAGGPIVGPGVGLARAPAPPRFNPEAERVGRVSTLIRQNGDAGTVFAVGAVSAREAAPFITADVPAVAIGGFSGNDPIFTVESFRAMAKRGEVRYFLMPSPGAPPGPGGRQQGAILSHIRRTWEDISTAAGLPPGTLYRYRGIGAGP